MKRDSRQFPLHRVAVFFRTTRPPTAAYTLVETMLAIVLVTIVGVGAVGAVAIARSSAEYNKQRLAAVAAANRFIEERVRRDLFPTLTAISDVTLDDFNTPNTEDDLEAQLSLKIYAVNTDGSRGAELVSAPTTIDRVEVEVTVSWNRTASRSGAGVSESVSTYVSPDL